MYGGKWQKNTTRELLGDIRFHSGGGGDARAM
jgi:hypothetical protein